MVLWCDLDVRILPGSLNGDDSFRRLPVPHRLRQSRFQGYATAAWQTDQFIRLAITFPALG
ncbi:hypothetical protein BD293_3943 [Roseinatronobacter monicus]|uniref:Uncharacterized protein n=1 Tax=Roseinatronobacter monicus TaxID=393481 RepID=A0A543K4M7_9RHOB|nr:hypothetical protein BD293_3943 [Roseinatronobacter monicus]